MIKSNGNGPLSEEQSNELDEACGSLWMQRKIGELNGIFADLGRAIGKEERVENLRVAMFRVLDEIAAEAEAEAPAEDDPQ